MKTLRASRQFARESFDKNRDSPNGSPEAEAGIDHAKGVAQILRENVVQGSRKKDETSKPMSTARHASDRWSSLTPNAELRIHEHTERGDNETIRKLKGTGKSFAAMK